MLIGHWSSNAFLRNIIKQVMEFSQNVVKRMFSYHNFRHIPDIHMRIPQDDPRIRNHPDNAKTQGVMLVETHSFALGCILFQGSIAETSPFSSAWCFQLMAEAHRIADQGSWEGFFNQQTIDSNPACLTGPSPLHIAYFIFIINFTRSAVVERWRAQSSWYQTSFVGLELRRAVASRRSLSRQNCEEGIFPLPFCVGPNASFFWSQMGIQENNLGDFTPILKGAGVSSQKILEAVGSEPKFLLRVFLPS